MPSPADSTQLLPTMHTITAESAGLGQSESASQSLSTQGSTSV